MEQLGNFSLAENNFINSYVESHSKKGIVAWLLWFFLGSFGAHRFYMGKTGSGIVMIVLLLLGFVTFGITSIAVVIWVLIDAFMINGWIRDRKEQATRDAIQTVLASRSNESGQAAYQGAYQGYQQIGYNNPNMGQPNMGQQGGYDNYQNYQDYDGQADQYYDDSYNSGYDDSYDNNYDDNYQDDSNKEN